MLSKTYIEKIKKEYLDYAEKRRDIIKFSGDALHSSKRAIFAMHRGEGGEAEIKLAETIFAPVVPARNIRSAMAHKIIHLLF